MHFLENSPATSLGMLAFSLWKFSSENFGVRLTPLFHFINVWKHLNHFWIWTILLKVSRSGRKQKCSHHSSTNSFQLPVPTHHAGVPSPYNFPPNYLCVLCSFLNLSASHYYYYYYFTLNTFFLLIHVSCLMSGGPNKLLSYASTKFPLF